MHCLAVSVDQVLKPMRFAILKQARALSKEQKAVKTHAPVHKRKAKRRPHAPGYSHPGGPAIRTTVYMRPRSFASPARTARTTRTKRKRRRNEADLPVTGGRINRSNSPKPPIYTYAHAYTLYLASRIAYRRITAKGKSKHLFGPCLNKNCDPAEG